MKKFFTWCIRYITPMSILVITFMVYTMFIQDNSLFRYMNYTNTIDSLNTEISNYTDTMKYYHQLNSQLSNDPALMERVVREQYNMNRDDEDVYIFE